MSGHDNQKKHLILGLVLMIAFVVVLVGMFVPIFGGRNGLNFLDNSYNSISKGSAYYIPAVKKDAEAWNGKEVQMTLNMADEGEAKRVDLIMKTAGAATEIVDKKKVVVKGDLGKIIQSSLVDADAMFYNQGKKVVDRYQQDERLMLYTWYVAFKAAMKDLTNQQKFEEAKVLHNVQARAVETAYNYYKIEPQNIKDHLGVAGGSLLFYVIYTIWYGFGVMFLFEGIGFKLSH
jgi:hypothetical protein